MDYGRVDVLLGRWATRVGHIGGVIKGRSGVGRLHGMSRDHVDGVFMLLVDRESHCMQRKWDNSLGIFLTHWHHNKDIYPGVYSICTV